jgi:hypothetical protein
MSMPMTAIPELRCDMAPRQLPSLAGLEHGRTIPLADILQGDGLPPFLRALLIYIHVTRSWEGRRKTPRPQR